MTHVYKQHSFDPEKAAARRIRQYEKWDRRAEIPSRFEAERLGTLTISTTVRAACQDLVTRLVDDEQPKGRGLLMWGPPGRGKSTIAVATLREVLHAVPPRHMNQVEGFGPNLPGYYIPFPGLIRLEKEAWNKDESGEDAEAMLRRLYCRGPRHDRVKVLVLDDVGKEHSGATGFSSNVLHDLLRSRYDDAAPTVITTNLKPSEWESNYGEAMHSFIHEAFTLVKVIGEDRRL